ncbi:glycoside hydrolase [Sistotremastrum suecicum HHB10207 ss-3]|uniref:Glycoside hydrolase n=1 Tax=Sistotremastrum suecicum HHB10207 ss-3 TaxID=1314776 RepID=A0A166IST1_9AGAM|nr:glycoside hydrolase [Sistotremastrum suecicum HHB10207 ss-3]
MLLDAANFTSILFALQLASSSFKPSPNIPGVGSAFLPQPDSFSGPAPLPSSAGPLSNQKQLLASGPATANQSCVVEPYTSNLTGIEEFPAFNSSLATIYRYRQQQSVNLGSWFVHEQWMTPSLFTCASGKQVAEIDIATGWGNTTNARAVLERHWDTFVTETDFQYLSSIGINTVRLPIGYWSLGPLYCQGTPFEPVADVYQGSWSRVVRAINLAAKHDIGVLIDLHGAPGSQNGQPHSGISDGEINLFNSTYYQNQTLSVLTHLALTLSNVTNVVGIELMNEPVNDPGLIDLYTTMLQSLRQLSPATEAFPFYIHDAFDLSMLGNFIAQRQDFIVQDHHSYFVYTSADNAESAEGHTDDVQTSVAQSLENTSRNQRGNLVVDEWSCALTPNSLSQEQNPDQAMSQFCQAQLGVYSNVTAGWSFWSYDLEDCATDPGWCFKNAVGNKLPSTFFSYSSKTMAPGVLIPIISNLSPPKDLRVAVPIQNVSVTASSSATPSPTVNLIGPSTTIEMSSVQPATTQDPTFARMPLASSLAAKENAISQKQAVSDNILNSAHSDRFMQIHRRKHRQLFDSGKTKRQQVAPASNSAASTIGSNSSESAVLKGYSDGFMTAKLFAQHDLSKLGFSGQYILDSLQAMNREGGGTMSPGDEEYYTNWFYQGLAAGEALVQTALDVLT